MFIPVTDSFEYETLAKSFVERGTFPSKLSIIRTPGYPLFIAFFYKIFGEKPHIVVLFQILFTSLLIPLIYSFSFITKREKNLFSIFYALNLNIALHTSQLLTEGLFMILIFMTILSFLYYLNSPTLIRLIQTSLLLALGTFTKPIGLYFSLVIGLFLLIKKGLKNGVLPLFIFLLSFLIFLSPWYIRNYIRFDKFFFCGVASCNLTYYEAPSAIASGENISVDKARKRLYNEFDEEALDRCEIHELNKDSKIALKYILKYPMPYAKLRMVGFLNTVLLPFSPRATLIYLTGKPFKELGVMKEVNQKVFILISHKKFKQGFLLFFKERVQKLPPSGIVVMGVAILYHFLLLFGVILSLRVPTLKKEQKILFIISILYFTFIPGTVGHPRFRIPIEPCLILLGVIGLASLEKSTKLKM
ncbi:glycosyltransferase family 39 protein [candidate division WOR-3 bacterium]|nr:glycosyltransferase family 39 protein [candidate division WOR-3 bacterium]